MKKNLKTEISKKEIQKLFYKIQLIRSVEEKIAKEYKYQKMRCPVHLSIGQEAIAAGISSALDKTDVVMSNHRSHAHYLAKGCDIKAMISELHGKSSGCAGGKGGSMHLIDLKNNFYGSTPIVASTIPIAAGISFANKIKKKSNNIVVIYFGDGACETGNFHETLNFCSLHNLQILFVCENNFFSVYTQLSLRQNNQVSINKIAQSHKISSISMNGNKVDEIYLQSKKIRNDIIKFKKPFLIEFKTYRHLEHCGVNDDDYLNYRNIEEINYWKKQCPIIYFKKKYRIYEKSFDRIQNDIDKKINLSFDFAKKASYPTLKKLYQNLYAK